MQLNDRLIGVLTLVGGAAVIGGTFGFRELPGQQFGSAFFPRIIGGALILTGVLLMLAPVRDRWVVIPDMLRGRALMQVVLVFAAVIVWVVVSPVLGFLATTSGLIFALIMLSGGRFVPAALTGIGMAGVLYAVFALLLRVPLPFGAIERMLT